MSLAQYTSTFPMTVQSGSFMSWMAILSTRGGMVAENIRFCLLSGRNDSICLTWGTILGTGDHLFTSRMIRALHSTSQYIPYFLEIPPPLKCICQLVPINATLEISPHGKGSTAISVCARTFYVYIPQKLVVKRCLLLSAYFLLSAQFCASFTALCQAHMPSRPPEPRAIGYMSPERRIEVYWRRKRRELRSLVASWPSFLPLTRSLRTPHLPCFSTFN